MTGLQLTAVLTVALLCSAQQVNPCSPWYGPADPIESRSLTVTPPFSCPSPLNSTDEVVRALNLFSSSLYLAGRGQGNFLFSPLSVFTGMGLVQLGTRGDTRKNWAEVLSYPQIKRSVASNPFDLSLHSAARSLMSSLASIANRSEGGSEVRAANNVFLDTSLSLVKQFEEKVACFYQSEVTRLELQTEAAGSSDQINSWVSEKTNNKIQDLLSADSLGPNTQMVLVNTVYLKAPWRHPFNKFATRGDQDFRREDGSKVMVDMMVLEKSLAYTKTKEGVQVVQLDYETDLAMYVSLPGEGGLAVMEDILLSGGSGVQGLEMEKEDVRLEIPRFEMRHEEALLPLLTSLGLDLAGDFSGMTEEATQLTDVLHQAYLRVDEEGTEGAAATALIMSRMLFIPRVTMRVDRTFLVSVVHKLSGAVLFMGKVDNPGRVKVEEEV